MRLYELHLNYFATDYIPRKENVSKHNPELLDAHNILVSLLNNSYKPDELNVGRILNHANI